MRNCENATKALSTDLILGAANKKDSRIRDFIAFVKCYLEFFDTSP